MASSGDGDERLDGGCDATCAAAEWIVLVPSDDISCHTYQLHRAMAECEPEWAHRRAWTSATTTCSSPAAPCMSTPASLQQCDSHYMRSVSDRRPCLAAGDRRRPEPAARPNHLPREVPSVHADDQVRIRRQLGARAERLPCHNVPSKSRLHLAQRNVAGQAAAQRHFENTRRYQTPPTARAGNDALVVLLLV